MIFAILLTIIAGVAVAIFVPTAPAFGAAAGPLWLGPAGHHLEVLVLFIGHLVFSCSLVNSFN